MSNTRIRTVIADDEELARERIRMLLEAHSDIEIVGQCANGHDAVTAIRRERPDLLFLDIQMPGIDGFGVLEKISELEAPAPTIVFVTAHEDYALRAFGVHALDYLLKPFDEARFEDTLERAREKLTAARANADNASVASLLQELRAARQPSPMRPERFVVKSNGRVLLLRVSEIDRVEAAGNYVHIHAGGEVYPARESMKHMEGRLDPRTFVRIHRSAIINVDRVRELQPWLHGEYIVLLRDGTELTASRVYVSRLSALLA